VLKHAILASAWKANRRRLSSSASSVEKKLSAIASFCIEAVKEALPRNGKSEIFNADRGSQFTSFPFTGMLLKHGIAISIDGRGAWRDSVYPRQRDFGVGAGASLRSG